MMKPLRILLVCLGLCAFSAKDHPPAEATAASAPAGAYVAMARGVVDVDGGMVHVTSERDGVVTQVLAQEGDRVRAGQTLVTLDDRQVRIAQGMARAELDQARAQLRLLTAKLPGARQRARRLAAAAHEAAVPRQSADDARADVTLLLAQIDAAKAAVEVAAKRLDDARLEVGMRTLKAPAGGLIVRRQVHVGDSVIAQSATPLFEVLPERPLIVRAQLNEVFADQVHAGMAADVVSDADPSVVRAARVLRVGAVVGRSPYAGDADVRPDERDVECVLTLADPHWRVGQRVLVRIKGG
jgi:RND family efflux transporter MFP subunit